MPLKPERQFQACVRLLLLNGRMFVEILKPGAVMAVAGLLYVFGGHAGIHLTVSKGIYLFTGALFTALVESAIIRRNGGGISFYMRLPIRRKPALAFFYLGSIAPILILFSFAFLLILFLLRTSGLSVDGDLLVTRYLHVLFAILFMKSFVVNLMIALSIHAVLIAGYFIALSFTLILIQWSLEVIPLFPSRPVAVQAVLLLASAYLISFLAVKIVRPKW